MDIKKLKNKKILYPAVAFAAGILMIMLSGLFNGSPEPKVKETAKDYKTLPNPTQTQRQLEEIISTVAGVSDVSVYVCYENNGVKVPAYTKEESTEISGEDKRSSQKTYVVSHKEGTSETPFVTREILPEIRGIIICAKGVEKDIKKLEIADAVSSAMGVPMSRVKVLSKN